MPGYFDLWTVLFSFLIASLAGYVAFESIHYTRYSPNPLLWTLVGGIALGGGVWSMHFVGMLAWHPPYPLYYSLGNTLLSVLAAVAASCLAMYITVNRQEGAPQRNLVAGAILVGAGICAMHYLGMGALHFTRAPEWSVPGVLLSIVIAVFASLGAMVMLGGSSRDTFSTGRQIIASLIIGAAVCGMHYTGMIAMMLPGGSVSIYRPGSFNGLLLARIGVGSGLLFSALLLLFFTRSKAHVRLARKPLEA